MNIMLKFKCNFWFIFSKPVFFSKQFIFVNLIIFFWHLVFLSTIWKELYQLSTITYLKLTFFLGEVTFFFQLIPSPLTHCITPYITLTTPPIYYFPSPQLPFFFSFFKNYTYKIWTGNLCIRIPAPYLLDHTGNSCKSPYVSMLYADFFVPRRLSNKR